MKTFLTLILQLLIAFLILVPSSLHSQSPLGIPYQVVMRNADGTVMASNSVELTFMIHDGSATGTVVYQESHSLTSNAQGLVSCVVGYGVVSQGNFANINWGVGAKFLHVMMGTTDLGTQQMLSVPYALYSNGVDMRVSEIGDTLTIGGNSVIVPGISVANPSALYTMGNGVTDIDGNFYPSIIINGQEWMQKNLAVSKYRNGDPIPTGLDNATWQSTTSGAYAIYNNDAANNTTYGKLYNWYAVNDSRGLCPTGWHVPSDGEWATLETSLGGSSVAGGKMKSTTGWNVPNAGATNESGFTGTPGGYRYEIAPYYDDISYYGGWWSSTQHDSGIARYRELGYDYSVSGSYYYAKLMGFSVRCVRDNSQSQTLGCTDGSACNFLANATQDDGSCLYQNATCDDGDVNTVNDVINSECVCAGTILPPPLYTMGNGVTDIDGNFYPSIIINGQEWMQQNLAVTKYRNGNPIPTGLDDANWESTLTGAFSIYNSILVNNTIYGKLYNWYAVNDSRGLCPSGWHVPSQDDWNFLESNLAGSGVGGGQLKSLTIWSSPNVGATNQSGFSALPGGYRGPGGQYNHLGILGYFWSSSESTIVGNSENRVLSFDNSYLAYSANEMLYGFSIRCLRD